MAREQKQSVACINIRVHPHTAQRYVQLLRDAFRVQIENNVTIKIRGDNHAILGHVWKVPGDESGLLLYGEISRFTNIDEHSIWINLRDRREAEKEDREKIVIPDNLKPNYAGFRYYFDARAHLFVFQVYVAGNTISPRMVEKFLNGLFSQPQIKRKYGEVELTISPDSEKIELILSMPILRQLFLHIRRPNPDDFGEDEKAVLESMDDQLMEEMNFHYKALKGQGISPSEKTRTLAHTLRTMARSQLSGAMLKTVRLRSRQRSTPRWSHHISILT